MYEEEYENEEELLEEEYETEEIVEEEPKEEPEKNVSSDSLPYPTKKCYSAVLTSEYLRNHIFILIVLTFFEVLLIKSYIEGEVIVVAHLVLITVIIVCLLIDLISRIYRNFIIKTKGKKVEGRVCCYMYSYIKDFQNSSKVIRILVHTLEDTYLIEYDTLKAKMEFERDEEVEVLRYKNTYLVKKNQNNQ